MNRVLVLPLMFASFLSSAEISRNNTVSWVAASTIQSGGSHFVQLKNQLQNPDDCKFGDGYRIRLSVEDKEIFSLLLAAKMSNQKVGFYYNTTTLLPAPSGHGTGCQFTNVWLES